MLRLVGTWRVSVLTSAAVAASDTPDEHARTAELAFDGDGQVYGSGGVNRLRGTWALAGDTLTFGPLVSTLVAGTPEAMRRESELLRLLAGPLMLRTPDGERVVAGDPARDHEPDRRAAALELVAADGGRLRLERTQGSDLL
ncbi:META domain-containing protein [Cellulomonas gilvus]|uniref:DUF306 domain-containing protein n=1 Tax=Cellulomonas gilvus (strain ATCC 13127 / NRRL B-14078) TaxID=593907 RepID=F8A0U7_CELGA|nr:META domain-containing protein [Cellulomonas gilvus]AEI11569.1 protein of unknown function DUF306 Meta and HslJ [Cellulomonas gilvus ATCC 13127]